MEFGRIIHLEYCTLCECRLLQSACATSWL